jgi:hypothetical protein
MTEEQEGELKMLFAMAGLSEVSVKPIVWQRRKETWYLTAVPVVDSVAMYASCTGDDRAPERRTVSLYKPGYLRRTAKALSELTTIIEESPP